MYYSRPDPDLDIGHGCAKRGREVRDLIRCVGEFLFMDEIMMVDCEMGQGLKSEAGGRTVLPNETVFFC